MDPKPTSEELAHAYRRGVEEAEGIEDPKPEADELLQAAHDLGIKNGPRT